MTALANPKPLPRIIQLPATIIKWVVVIGWLVYISGLEALPAAASADNIKAGFLTAFPQFTTWPDRTFATTNSPVVIGVLGDASFRDILELTARQQKSPRPLEIRPVNSLADALQCQIVFIDQTESDKETDWLP